jgi:hypothetical protein
VPGDTANALAFAGGAIAGALATATLVLVARGLVSPVPVRVAAATGVAASAAIALVALVHGGCPLWQTRRQIAPEVVLGRTPRGAFAFAFQLGTGLVTYLPSCAPHVLALSLVLLPVPVAGVVVAAAGFGAGRSAVFVARMSVRPRDLFEARVQRVLPAVARAAPGLVLGLAIVATAG